MLLGRFHPLLQFSVLYLNLWPSDQGWDSQDSRMVLEQVLEGMGVVVNPLRPCAISLPLAGCFLNFTAANSRFVLGRRTLSLPMFVGWEPKRKTPPKHSISSKLKIQVLSFLVPSSQTCLVDPIVEVSPRAGERLNMMEDRSIVKHSS